MEFDSENSTSSTLTSSLERKFINVSNYPSHSSAISSCCPENSNYSNSITSLSSKDEETLELSTRFFLASDVDEDFLMKDDMENYYENMERQYNTPFSIILLNLCLCTFLMIVIGIAVYPAVKKYCDTTFPSTGTGTSSETINWIEDTDEFVSVVVNSAETSDDSNFILLNGSSNRSCTGTDSPSRTDSKEGAATGDFELIATLKIERC